MIELSKQVQSHYLRDLWIEECHEGEGPEGLRDEDVGDLSELGEVVPEVFCRHVLGAAADEHLAGNLLYLTLLQRKKESEGSLHWSITVGHTESQTEAHLRVGDLDVAPSAVDHVPLGEDPHLGLVAGEPDEPEPLGLPRFGVLLHLRHEHLADGLKVLPQLRLGGLPRQAEHDQVRALVLVHLLVLGLGCFPVVVRSALFGWKGNAQHA